MTDRPWHDYTPSHDADHRAGILAEWGVVDESDGAAPEYVLHAYRREALAAVRARDEARAQVEAAREAMEILIAERKALAARLEEIRVAAGVADASAVVGRIRSLRSRSR